MSIVTNRSFSSIVKNKRDNSIADHFNQENHTATSYSIKIVGQEEDKNKRL